MKNKYRLKFTKEDRLVFIGHLDLLKVFQRAINRCDLPIQYSNGFNPHQQMSFALPLSLGMESFGEYIDIELTKDFEPEIIIESLNKQLPAGCKIVGCRRFFENEKAGAAILESAYYLISTCLSENIDNICEEIMASSEILVMKKTKKTFKEVNIRPDIITLGSSISQGNVVLNTILSAGSENNLKPQILYKYICEKLGTDYIEWKNKFTRVEMFRNENEKLIPLID